MTKLFWSLVRIRIALLFQSGKKTNNAASTGASKTLGKIPRIILIAILAIYCIAVFFGMFGVLFYSVGASFGDMGLEWFYFTLAAMFAFALSFIGSVFATQTQLYDAKDNELLLSMPILPKFILASRMVALLTMNLMYEAIVMLPAIVVWGMLGKFTVGSAIGVIVLLVTVPFVSMSVSCMVGWLIALLTSKVKRKNLITTILSFIALVAYLAVYSLASDYMELLINNGEQIANAVKKGFYPAYALGLAGNGNYVMMLICLVATAALFALIYWILDRTFIKISTAKSGTSRIKYKAKQMKKSGVTVAFVKKEFISFISNPMYIMNASLGVIFSVVASGFLVINGKALAENFTMVGLPSDFLEIIVMTAMLALTSFNVISAPSISLEAKTLWLLKSLPVDPSQILLAKAWNHFIISEVGVLLTGASAAIFLPVSVPAKLLVFVLPTAFNAYCALFGVFINLLLPKFNWINETVAIKQGMSSLVCMLAPMGIIALYIIPYMIWFVQYINVAVYTLVFTILIVVAAFLIYSYLTGRGIKRFNNLGQ